MLAIALTLSLCGFWLVLGQAVLTLIYRHNDPLHNMLLAPVVGMGTLLLPLFWLSRLNFPVKQVALPLTLILGALSVVTLWWKSTCWPWRRYYLFGFVLLVALGLSGWPMLEFGFDWLGFGNSDVSHWYAPSAHRLLNYGLYATKNAEYFSRI